MILTSRFLRLFLAVMLAGSTIGVAGEPIYLFPPLRPNQDTDDLRAVDGYENILDSLKGGEILAFEDGAQFEYTSDIGRGSTSRILKVISKTGRYSGTVLALRMPISNQKLSAQWASTMIYYVVPGDYAKTYSHYINATLEFTELFASKGFAPRFYGGLAGEYVAHEFVEKKFTLDEYLTRKVRFAGRDEEKVRAALLRFEAQTAGIGSISDISQPGQIIFDGKDFILVDWYGVDILGREINPWGFVSVNLEGDRLFREGMIARGLAGQAIFERRISVRNPYTPLTAQEISDREWQLKLASELESTFVAARLDMLESGVNPITGQAPTHPLTFWERHFGLWRPVFRLMEETRQRRVCHRMITPNLFGPR